MYTHKDAVQLVTKLGAERIHRVEQLEVYAMDFEWLSALAQRLQRRTSFTLTVSEQHLYLSVGEETFSGVIRRVPVGAKSRRCGAKFAVGGFKGGNGYFGRDFFLPVRRGFLPAAGGSVGRD